MLTRHPDIENNLNLAFEPVRNEEPRMFSREQIAQYNEQGFIEPVQIFKGEELEELQRFFAEQADEVTHKSGPFESYHQVHAGLFRIISHPRTTAFLQDILGPNVVCHVSQFINKPPGQEKGKGGSHHQDATYNAMDARCAIVWLAIEDAEVENGCMWFIPGTHKLGVVECTEDHFVVKSLQYGEEIPCEVKAGHAVFMSDLLMHSSPPNRSKERHRPGLTATYAPAEVKPYKNTNRSAILCRGKDAAGNWNVHPVPR